MNHYELVIKRSKKLESILEENFGAKGTGLHQKTTSVENKLPKELIRKLHKIATIRNTLVHEVTVDELDDPDDFENTFNDAEKSLEAIIKRRSNIDSDVGCLTFFIQTILFFLGVFFGIGCIDALSKGEIGTFIFCSIVLFLILKLSSFLNKK